ncbi:MAG: hypothetical protein C4523_00980 [Myxococcales bacterium]|nr:MAG: hypothetical protein C4523_00980 [Myxococcales bacterium]
MANLRSHFSFLACVVGGCAAAGLLFGFLVSSAYAAAEGRVVYVAGEMVYLDRGLADGCAAGDTLTLSRRGREIANLRITEASEHRAAGIVENPTQKPQPGDSFACGGKPVEEAAPATGTKRTPTPLWSEAEMGGAWPGALTENPPQRVVYKGGSEEGDVSPSADGVVESWYEGGSQFSPAGESRHEQIVALWARGRDLGVRGLGLRVRGEVGLRYDAEEDRYLTGQRALPLIRQLELKYENEPTGIVVAAGRVVPSARPAGLLDGGELGWSNPSLSFFAYGGLRPTSLDLIPSAERPAGGAGVSVHPVSKTADWRVTGGYHGEFGQGQRHAVYLDNRLGLEDALLLIQTATLELFTADESAYGNSGPNLADAALLAASHPLDWLDLEANVRYVGAEPLVEETADLPAEWLAALKDSDSLRADGAIGFWVTEKRRRLRPYGYYLRESDATGSTWAAAGGLAYLEREPGGAPLEIEVSGDYGEGDARRAQAALDVTGELLRERIWAGAGYHVLWLSPDGRDFSEMEHLGTLSLSGEPFDAFTLWLLGQAAYDHTLVAPSFSRGWYILRAGLRYSW